MDNRNALVGWSEDQWDRIRQVVSEEAHKARVAATFLPTYGPLPSSTEVVPSERFNPTTGRVDDVSTAPMVEIYEEVVLSRQQVNEEELSSALLAFRRAANDLARVEDRIIFNGQFGYSLTTGTPARTIERITDERWRDQYKLRSDTSTPPTSVYGRVKVKDGESPDENEARYIRNRPPAIFSAIASNVNQALLDLADALLYRKIEGKQSGQSGAPPRHRSKPHGHPPRARQSGPPSPGIRRCSH